MISTRLHPADRPYAVLVGLALLSLAVLLLWPSIALAGAIPATWATDAQPLVLEPPPSTFLGSLMTAVLGILGTVFSVVLGIAGGAIRTWAKGKAFEQLVDALWLKVETIVRHAEAEIRPMLQQALADGKLSPEEAKAIKSKVLDLVRESAQGEIHELSTRFGFAGAAVETLLSGLVEKAVGLLGAPVPGTTNPIEKLT